MNPGWILSDALGKREQAGEQDIDLMAMEDGETVSFTAVNYQYKSNTGRRCDKRGYYYGDYGLSYVTW